MAGCEAHEDSICACECVVHLFIQKAWMWSGSPALFGQVALAGFITRNRADTQRTYIYIYKETSTILSKLKAGSDELNK